MFKGFSSPNFTQTPNEFFEIIQQKGITIAEVKLLSFMIRYTFGWQRAGFTLQFTFSDIQKHTNLQSEATNNAISKCLEKGYIERKEMAGKYYYRLRMESSEQLDWNYTFDWKPRATTSEIEVRPLRKSKYDHFGNRSTTTSEIEVTHNSQSKKNQGSSESLNKGLNKELNKDINNLSNLQSERIQQWVESLQEKQIDRLDYKLKIFDSVYSEMKFIEGFDDSLFIEKCNDVLNAENPKNPIPNFKGYLKKSIRTEIKQQKREVAQTENNISNTPLDPEAENQLYEIEIKLIEGKELSKDEETLLLERAKNKSKSKSNVPSYILLQVEKDRIREKAMEQQQLESEVSFEEVEELIRLMKQK